MTEYGQFCKGEEVYIVKLYTDDRVDLSDKDLDYFPQDDCIPERTAHRVPVSLIE
jgi:hypothetical protein